MDARKPVVAGQFYPDEREKCIEDIRNCVDARTLGANLPQQIIGGIVPHAGWIFSGSLAAMVFSAIKKRHNKVDTFVIFGAAHSYFGPTPAVYDKGGWITPLGEAFIDEDLAEAVDNCGLSIADKSAHRSEHSIEVQLPFVKYFFPEARILPIVVPAAKEALPLGECVGGLIASREKRKIVCLGSTDLTHYGPHYGLDFMGVGPQAFKWATEVNDKQFIDLALSLEAEAILVSSAENQNACGAGAVAATIAAVKKQGKSKGMLLAHTSSSEVMLAKMGTSGSDSVGYAAIVY